MVAGLLIILRSAAKITHQAQALTGHAAKWHACATIEPCETDEIDSSGITHTRNPSSVYSVNFSDELSDEDSTTGDDDELLENTKFIGMNAHTISFQKRQALGNYFYIKD
jgi:Protein of unknown function (DUF3537)